MFSADGLNPRFSDLISGGKPLWTITGLTGPLLLILFAQTALAAVFILFILFPLMGRDYQAAVLAAGFGGFAMGATPTVVANITVLTSSHGPAPPAFIVLPLVAAFFADVANAFIMRFATGQQDNANPGFGKLLFLVELI